MTDHIKERDLLAAAREDHAYATGGVAGAYAASIGPIAEKTFRESMERMRAAALKVIRAEGASQTPGDPSELPNAHRLPEPTLKDSP